MLLPQMALQDLFQKWGAVVLNTWECWLALSQECWSLEPLEQSPSAASEDGIEVALVQCWRYSDQVAGLLVAGAAVGWRGVANQATAAAAADVVAAAAGAAGVVAVLQPVKTAGSFEASLYHVVSGALVGGIRVPVHLLLSG